MCSSFHHRPYRPLVHAALAACLAALLGLSPTVLFADVPEPTPAEVAAVDPPPPSPAPSPAPTLSERPARPMGYGTMLLRMLFTLGAVCLIAVVGLRWGLRRLVPDDRRPRHLAIVAHLPVGPMRAVFVIRVGSKHLIVGSADGGLSRLGELTEKEAEIFQDDNPLKNDAKSFLNILNIGADRQKRSP